MAVFPQYNQQANTPARGLTDDLPWLKNLWSALTESDSYTPPAYPTIGPLSTTDPGRQREFGPDWTVTDALNQISQEHAQRAQRDASGETTIGPADPYKQARLNSQTSFVDWASPTLGKAMSGQTYDPAELISDLVGWADAPAKGLLGAAGMVRMGGQDVAKAFLHRALDKPQEVEWLSGLFNRGGSTQKPTSLVAPGYLPTFRSHEYGMLFHGPEDKISHAGLEDVYSKKSVRRDRATPLQTALDKIIDRLGPDFPGEPPEVLPASKYSPVMAEWKQVIGELLSRNEPSYHTDARLIENLLDKIMDQGGRGHPGEVWTPELTDNLVDPKATTVTDFLSRVQALVKRHPQNSHILHHNEIIPEIDRSMLAGIRVPRAGSEEDYNERLSRALREFAEQQGVPIYSWPADWSRRDQHGMLRKPLLGSWVGGGTSDDPFTSSEVERLLMGGRRPERPTTKKELMGIHFADPALDAAVNPFLP